MSNRVKTDECNDHLCTKIKQRNNIIVPLCN